MANCPLCGSKLEIVKFRWLTNFLGLTKPYFICPVCKWKKKLEDMHKEGGLLKIQDEKRGIIRKSPKSKVGHHKPYRRQRNFRRNKKRRRY